jgi:flotillin
MVDVILVTIAVLIIVIGTGGGLLLYSRCYVRVPPNKVLVVYGRRQPGKAISYDFYTNGGRFVMPIFEDHGFMPLETFMDKLELNDVITKDHNHLRLSLLFDYKIRSDGEGLQVAAQNFFGKSNDTLKEAVEAKVSVAIMDVLGGHELENIVSHRAQISKDATARAAEALHPLGLDLKSVSIKGIQEHGVVVSDVPIMKGHLKDLRFELAELEGKLAAIDKEQKK